ncbi:MAG: LuxR C-terminal-related transcriptional regulator [Pseudomonadota bacterium]
MSDYTTRSEPVGIERDLNGKAIRADAASKTEMLLADLWVELVSARARVIANFNTSTRCFLVLDDHPRATSCEPAPLAHIDQRNVEILRRVLRGDAQKVIAMDLHLSPSSVSAVAGQTLRSMGLRCVPTRVPVVVLMAAHAHYQEIDSLTARQSMVVAAEKRYRILSVPRPDPSGITVLSDAERSVVDLLLERRSNAEIARLRATSPRTVANQLANVVQKLRVGGRCGIVHRLICAPGKYWSAQMAFGAKPANSSVETEAKHLGNVSEWA